jgi:hypothetical protein
MLAMLRLYISKRTKEKNRKKIKKKAFFSGGLKRGSKVIAILFDTPKN